MNEEARARLLFGPYEPPRIPRNQRLLCEYRGYLRVSKTWSDGRIPWPRRYRTGSIILCGDLVEAVKKESVEAVCHHWGVCRNVVNLWRKALGVPEMNSGTRQLRRRARRDARPESQRRATRMARGESVQPRPRLVHERGHPLVRVSTSHLAKDRMARTGHFSPELRIWTPKEDKFLGTAPDNEIAGLLKRTPNAVGSRRRFLGIPAWRYSYSRPWTAEEEALLGVVPDRKLAKRLKRTFCAVQARRETRGLPPIEPQRRRFTSSEDALLGTMHDDALAKKLGRSPTVIAERRHYLNIPMNGRTRSRTDMSRKERETDRAADYLNHLLTQAAEAGADTVLLERVPGGLEICFLAGGAGLGTVLKDRELESELIELVVRRAGLENRATGRMDWDIRGENWPVTVEEYDSFGESCFRLKLGKAHSRPRGKTEPYRGRRKRP